MYHVMARMRVGRREQWLDLARYERLADAVDRLFEAIGHCGFETTLIVAAASDEHAVREARARAYDPRRARRRECDGQFLDSGS